MRWTILVILFLATSSYADEVYIENGVDVNGNTVFGYIEVDDTDIIDGFVKDVNGNIIFLEDKSQNNIKKDFFNQEPRFEDDVDFFGQDYEINLEEE